MTRLERLQYGALYGLISGLWAGILGGTLYGFTILMAETLTNLETADLTTYLLVFLGGLPLLLVALFEGAPLGIPLGLLGGLLAGMGVAGFDQVGRVKWWGMGVALLITVLAVLEGWSLPTNGLVPPLPNVSDQVEWGTAVAVSLLCGLVGSLIFRRRWHRFAA